MTITKFKEELLRAPLGDFIVTPVIMENSHKLSDVGRAGKRRYFNAHHGLWGSNLCSADGNILVEALDVFPNLVVVNDGLATRATPPGHIKSVVDLTIISSSLCSAFDWTVLSDTYGSDHFPIRLSVQDIKFENTIFTSSVKWSMSNANWEKFRDSTFMNTRGMKLYVNALSAQKPNLVGLDFVPHLVGTSPSEIWKRVNKIQGKKKYTANDEDIVESLFTKISPDYVHLPVFMPSISTNDHFLLTPISADELKTNIKSSENTAPGIDGINYSMLLNLPVIAIHYLCKLYNNILIKGDNCDSLKQCLVIPIPKVFIQCNDRLIGPRVVHQGLPQASALSSSLYNLYTIDLHSTGIKCNILQYADDFCFYTVNNSYQQSINSIKTIMCDAREYFFKQGFELTTKKSAVVFFTRHRLPVISSNMFNSLSIPVQNHYTYLGIILDTKLTWDEHINKCLMKCEKSLNIFKVVNRYRWGADPKINLMFYRAYTRSILDYGSFLYGSATNSLLKKLDRLQYKALRLVLGALKSTPTENLLAESMEPP
ncbi:uncharacterized protein [Diabrotica undecimpunctata]|uniref:uncharacterized protein n=1 Tax=Diabrotica undecimpunctata TaxID=50387 RepID=UPI003B63B4D2